MKEKLIITPADCDADGFYNQRDLIHGGDVEVSDKISVFRVKGNVEISGNQYVRGNQDVGGNQDVRGNQDVGGDQDVGGNQVVRGNQDVGGYQVVRGNQDVGGYQDVGGNQYVGGNQDVRGNQYVRGDQDVGGNQDVGGYQVVRGNQDVSGNQDVRGNQDVSGNKKIHGDKIKIKGRTLLKINPTVRVGPIGSRNSYTTAYLAQDGIEIKCRCFEGTFAAFKDKIAKTYQPENHYRQQYDAACAYIESVWAAAVKNTTSPVEATK
jgi:hypothetical protein